jgi:hypothetical protein
MEFYAKVILHTSAKFRKFLLLNSAEFLDFSYTESRGKFKQENLDFFVLKTEVEFKKSISQMVT